MIKEIGLWIKEQILAAFAAIGRLFKRFWHFLVGQLRLVGWAKWRIILASLPVVFFLYIGVGMVYFHRMGDDLSFKATPPAGGSSVVATLSKLVNREVNQFHWTANDPAIQPGYYLDNLPNFQKGMMGALSRFGLELRDQLGRMRGSSATDPDLEKAAGNLSKEPDRWVIDWRTSWLPTTPSDSYYREAVRQLDAYNARLSTGDAVFEKRSDNLLAALDRVALDLGASSAAIDNYIQENSGGFLPDTGADDLFYQVKGQVYAYHMLLAALEEDYTDIIQSQSLGPIYKELLQSLKLALSLDPILVTNGAIDGVLANHLSMQGFYLLRARTQMREVTNILLK